MRTLLPTLLAPLWLLAACAGEEEPVANRFERTEAAIENKAQALEAQVENEVGAVENRLDNEASALLNQARESTENIVAEPAANQSR